jgi:hypothetical protein
MIKAWLRKWLGVDDLAKSTETLTKTVHDKNWRGLEVLDYHVQQIRELNISMAHLQESKDELVGTIQAIRDQAEIESTLRLSVEKDVIVLRAELAQLILERYVPPITPEPERKIIKTRNFKEYIDILEQEQSREHSDAS